MYEENYESPNGPDLDMDDLNRDSIGEVMMGQYSHKKAKKSHGGAHVDRFKSKTQGNFVGHQQYGNWQE